jgi:Sel1 repeat
VDLTIKHYFLAGASSALATSMLLFFWQSPMLSLGSATLAHQLSPTTEATEAVDPERSNGDGFAAFRRHDYATALQYLKPKADEGMAEAQTILGIIYHQGQGVPRNDAESVKWFRKAADQGDAQAKVYLAMYSKGLNQKQPIIELTGLSGGQIMELVAAVGPCPVRERIMPCRRNSARR